MRERNIPPCKARKRKEVKKACYLQNSHNCLQSAFASTDKYVIYLINLFRQGGHAAAHEGKHTNAPKNGEAFITVWFWFVYKTIRGTASASSPQKHLPWFKALINSLEMDLHYDVNQTWDSPSMEQMCGPL